MKTRNLLVLLTVVLLAGSLLIAPAAAADSAMVTKGTVLGTAESESGTCVLDAGFVRVTIKGLETEACEAVTLKAMTLPNGRFSLDFSPSMTGINATLTFTNSVTELWHQGNGKPICVLENGDSTTVETFSRYSGWF